MQDSSRNSPGKDKDPLDEALDEAFRDAFRNLFNDAAAPVSDKLVAAARCGDIGAYQLLRGQGAAADEDALWEAAAEGGHDDMLQLFVQEQDSVSRSSVNKALTAAARHNRKDTIGWLHGMVGMVGPEELAVCAATAVKAGHEDLGRWLAEKVIKSPLQAEKKGKLCAEILRACAHNGRMSFAEMLLAQAKGDLLPFAHAAISGKQIEALRFFTEKGIADKSLAADTGEAPGPLVLSPVDSRFKGRNGLEQLLLSSFDKDFKAGAEYLCAAGADVSSYGNAAVIRAVGRFDGEDFSWIDLLLRHGANPDCAYLLAQEEWSKDAFAAHGGKIKAVADAAREKRLRELADAIGEPTVATLRLEHAALGESGFHFAARYRILDQVLARVNTAGMTEADWQAQNSRGESVAVLLQRGGHARDIFKPSLWIGAAPIAAALWGLLGEPARAGVDFAGFMHETNTASLRRNGVKTRFRLSP